MAASIIANPLTNLFNYCIVTATFLKILKSAKVIPIFKSGDKKIVCSLQTNFIIITFF